MVAHIFNSSMGEKEAGRSLCTWLTIRFYIPQLGGNQGPQKQPIMFGQYVG